MCFELSSIHFNIYFQKTHYQIDFLKISINVYAITKITHKRSSLEQHRINSHFYLTEEMFQINDIHEKRRKKECTKKSYWCVLLNQPTHSKSNPTRPTPESTGPHIWKTMVGNYHTYFLFCFFSIHPNQTVKSHWINISSENMAMAKV